MARVSIDIKPIEAAAKAAFNEAVGLLSVEFTKVISEPGAFPGFKGDLVDKGQFRSSQDVQFVSDSEAQFSWPVEYAQILKDGAEYPAGESWEVNQYERLQNQAFGRPISAKKVKVKAHTRTRKESRSVEGRDWIALGLERFNFQQRFDQILAMKLRQ